MGVTEPPFQCRDQRLEPSPNVNFPQKIVNRNMRISKKYMYMKMNIWIYRDSYKYWHINIDIYIYMYLKTKIYKAKKYIIYKYVQKMFMRLVFTVSMCFLYLYIKPIIESMTNSTKTRFLEAPKTACLWILPLAGWSLQSCVIGHWIVKMKEQMNVSKPMAGLFAKDHVQLPIFRLSNLRRTFLEEI